MPCLWQVQSLLSCNTQNSRTFYSTLGEPYFTLLHIMFGELHHNSGRHAGAEINTASPFIWGVFFFSFSHHVSLSVKQQ